MNFLKIFQRKNNDADKFFKEQKTAQKSSRGLFFSKTMAIPKTAQDTIPFVEAYDNGLFLVDEDTYTLIFAFENIDYSLLRDEEQYDCYEKYQKLLNALPPDIPLLHRIHCIPGGRWLSAVPYRLPAGVPVSDIPSLLPSCH